MTEAEIHALSRMLDRLDYYKLLRIEHDATGPKVREAYHKMRRAFHPDAYLGHPDELRAAVAGIARRVNEGYQVLRDSGRRNAYNETLEKGQLRYSAETEDTLKTQVEAPEGTTPKGKKFFSQAKAAERTGDLATAVSTLKMALTFEADNEHFQRKLAELEAELKKKTKKSNPHAIR